MDRAARAKKPNKAASALESLRAIKAGEAKAIDNYGIEDEDVVFEDDDGDINEYEDLEPAEPSESNATNKRKLAGTASILVLHQHCCHVYGIFISCWIQYFSPSFSGWVAQCAVQTSI